MKKRLLSILLTLCMVLTLLPVAAFAEGETDVSINETNFPDANFRTVVKEYDTDKDENLSRAEIEAVKEIKCYYKDIRSLTGIEYFTALQTLKCYSNQLTSLDISENTALKSLDCAKNQLAALDVSQNTRLNLLLCFNNHLTSLDTSNQKWLHTLSCDNNNYPITITNDRNYDLSDLPGTFDVNKASNWSGGTVSGNNILTVDHDKDSVTYTYDCGNGRTANFMLTCGKASYTVNFNTNGGSEVDTQTVVHGEKVVKPADPKLNGFTFGGWYTDEDCTDENKYDFETPVTANFTLYAKWEGTFYGIRITDKDGNAVYVTSENANDVLGDGTVSYVPGYLEEGKDIADFTAEDLDKMLRGETVEGIRLPKLTLNGASFKQLAVGNWGDDLMTQQLNLHLQLELVGDSSIAYDETYLAEGAVYSKNVWALYITGNGKLNVSADRLYNDYGIRYESKRTHEGRVVKLTLENSGA